jgi:hypothetical protein
MNTTLKIHVLGYADYLEMMYRTTYNKVECFLWRPHHGHCTASHRAREQMSCLQTSLT